MPNTFKNVGGAVGTTATTLYTCPAATQAVIHALYVANVDGAISADATIEVYDSSALVSRKIGFKIPVPAGGTLGFDKPINLEVGDELRVTASTAGDLEAFASVLEIS